MDIRENTKLIKQEAIRLGFNHCGTSKAEFLEEEVIYYLQWIEKGYNAGLGYMEHNIAKRFNPQLLVEGTRSVISVILNYFPSSHQIPGAPVISKYAYGKDYHLVVKRKLNQLLDFIREKIPGAGGRVFTDSSPVLEHALARRSGLGWIGKNSLLLTRKHGSFVFIGEIFLNVELEYDTPVKDLCGNCSRCIDACPTQAIVADRVIDAGKCISYNTIENKNDFIPEIFRNKFMNRIFGCDICQDVCPWNQKVEPHNVEEFNPEPELMNMTEAEWHSLSREKFDELFHNSPVKRAKFEGIKRNLDFIGKNNLNPT